jgi:DNA polymerase III alpha subunit
MRHGPDILENCLIDAETAKQYFQQVDLERLSYPLPKLSINKENWFIPHEYQDMDIEAWVWEQCPPWDPENTRVKQELELFKINNMLPVLKTIKYIVDILRANNIVWGVGRGSSVASYVLHLIGIHKINSVKYNLPIDEFFKGEQNG